MYETIHNRRGFRESERSFSLKQPFPLNNAPSSNVTFQYSQIGAYPEGFFIVRQRQNAKCQCIWCTDMLSELQHHAHVAHSTALPSFLIHHVAIVWTHNSVFFFFFLTFHLPSVW